MRTLISALAFTIALFSLHSCGGISTLPLTEDDYQINTEYGQIDPSKNAFAISSVKVDPDLISYNTTTEYLVNRVAGLKVTEDGGLSIRETKNYTGQYVPPMLILDGREISDIDVISPVDIYSVDVIKDGASAMYGSRGAGGVIVITSNAAHQAQEAEKVRKKVEKLQKKNK